MPCGSTIATFFVSDLGRNYTYSSDLAREHLDCSRKSAYPLAGWLLFSFLSGAISVRTTTFELPITPIPIHTLLSSLWHPPCLPVQDREAKEQEELNILADTDPVEYDRRIKEWHKKKLEIRERGGVGDEGVGDGLELDFAGNLERRKSLARERRDARYFVGTYGYRIDVEKEVRCRVRSWNKCCWSHLTALLFARWVVGTPPLGSKDIWECWRRMYSDTFVVVVLKILCSLYEACLKINSQKNILFPTTTSSPLALALRPTAMTPTSVFWEHFVLTTSPDSCMNFT